MNIPHYKSAEVFRKQFRQASVFSEELTKNVVKIIRAVRSEGDQAVLRFTRKFDQVERETLGLTSKEWEHADAV